MGVIKLEVGLVEDDVQGRPDGEVGLKRNIDVCILGKLKMFLARKKPTVGWRIKTIGKET